MAKKAIQKSEDMTSFGTMSEKPVGFLDSVTGAGRKTRYAQPNGKSGGCGQSRKGQMKGDGQSDEGSRLSFPSLEVGRGLDAGSVAVCDEWEGAEGQDGPWRTFFCSAGRRRRA